MAAELDIDRVLQLIVDRVRELVGATYAALGIADGRGRIERFITSGISPEARAMIGEAPHGRGMLGLIIRDAKVIRTEDIAERPDRYGFPANHPVMHSFLGVPVIVKGRSVGNLYLAEKLGGPFSEDDERLVEMFAVHAGIAIENARLHDQVQRLAIVEERERIGKDLHDGIIQSIYAVGLSLEDVPELVEDDGGRDEAVARVDRAIDALNLVISDIRSYILRLRPTMGGEEDPVEALARLAEELGMHAVIDLEVDLDSGAALLRSMPPDRRSDILFIAREALSNVARHSGATRTALVLLDRRRRARAHHRGQRTGLRPRRPDRSRRLRAAPGRDQHAQPGGGPGRVVQHRATRWRRHAYHRRGPSVTPRGHARPRHRRHRRELTVTDLAPHPLRLLVVDDHEVVRQGLVALLDRREGFQVVAEAGTAAESIEQARRFQPDIVVMDVRLPDGSGIEACREIRAELPQTRVVMLTSYPDEEAVLSAIVAGASGYLLKQIRARDLVAALENVGRGESLLDPAVTEKVLERVRRIATGAYTDEMAQLTAQEQRILLLVAEGKTNKEIAAEVFLSDKTVKNYVSSILSKLNLERRAQAAAFVAKHRLDRGGA